MNFLFTQNDARFLIKLYVSYFYIIEKLTFARFADHTITYLPIQIYAAIQSGHKEYTCVCSSVILYFSFANLWLRLWCNYSMSYMPWKIYHIYYLFGQFSIKLVVIQWKETTIWMILRDGNQRRMSVAHFYYTLNAFVCVEFFERR